MNSKPNITIAEVAEAAGVGESTVSRVLRNEGSFSAKSRAKVMQAASRLGYVPNRIAGSLASSGSRLVAMIVPSISNIVFADLLHGAGEVLDGEGFRGVFGVTDYEPVKEEQLVASFLEYRPAAVLLVGLEHTARTQAMLQAARCRVVEMLDLDTASEAGSGLDILVGFSNVEAGRSAARHLVLCGHRRIGYVGHDLARDRRAAKRLAGFEEGLAEHGLVLAGKETSGEASSVGSGKESLARLLAREPELDAVYFANDDLAIGGYFHCLAAGIAVPGRIGIFGHNGLDIGAALPQPLSTIRTPRVDIGRIAARLALSGATPQQVAVPFELIAGATTRTMP